MLLEMADFIAMISELSTSNGMIIEYFKAARKVKAKATVKVMATKLANLQVDTYEGDYYLR